MNELIILCAKYLIYVVAVVGVGYLLTLPGLRRIQAFAVLCLGGIASYAVGFLVGHVYYDPRPFVVGNFTPLIAHAADNGFPSDHMLLASVIALAVFYYNRTVGNMLFIAAVIIGAARVLAGVHHWIDIWASAAIGLIAVSVVYYSLRVVMREA